jgi:hypothetical protein
MNLYTMTLTRDEVECLFEQGFDRLRGVASRAGDGPNGMSNESRKLILDAVEANGEVDFHSPDWWIYIALKVAEGKAGFEENGWTGMGSLSYEDGPGHTVRNVHGETPEAVLDAILDFHGCGPNRSIPFDLGDE